MLAEIYFYFDRKKVWLVENEFHQVNYLPSVKVFLHGTYCIISRIFSF